MELTGPIDTPKKHDPEFDRRVLRAAALTSLVVVGVLLGALLLWELRIFVLLLLFALFAGAMLHPIVNWVQGLGAKLPGRQRPLPRVVGTAIVFFAAAGVVAGLLALIVHPLIGSASHLVKQLPTLVSQAQQGKGQVGHLVKRLDLLKFVQSRQANLQQVVSKLSKPAFAVGKSVASGLFSLLTVFFLTFFVLLDAPRMVRVILDWMEPTRAARARAVIDDVGKAVSGFVMANIATSLIAGIIIGVTLWIVGVPFFEVMGLWVVLVDFLPMVGGLLAGVPVVAIAFLHSLPAGIVVLVVFVVYQEIENHVLSPIIMSRTVKLNPLGVLVAVLVGAQLGDLFGSVFGALLGALISVPTACAVQVIGSDLWAHRGRRLHVAGTKLAQPNE